jgi:hypothetical protein
MGWFSQREARATKSVALVGDRQEMTEAPIGSVGRLHNQLQTATLAEAPFPKH